MRIVYDKVDCDTTVRILPTLLTVVIIDSN